MLGVLGGLGSWAKGNAGGEGGYWGILYIHIYTHIYIYIGQVADRQELKAGQP